MPIDDISSLSPYSAVNTLPKKELDKDAFLKLLVTQIQAQDPMEPTTNQEFIGQLANFSSLEQMKNLNDGVVGLAMIQQDTSTLLQMTNGSALIGKQIEYTDADGAAKSGKVDALVMKDGYVYLKVGADQIGIGDVTKVLDPSASDSTDGSSENDGGTDGGEQQ